MSQLPSEFEKIVIIAQQFYESEYKTANAAIRYAAERCFALANKPVRALTSAEITEEYQKTYPADKPTRADFTVIRAILAAHQRKQQEPETVTFRAARYKDGHQVHMMLADETLEPIFEWLPGEPQTIEVKLP